jgi:hypothetical protein
MFFTFFKSRLVAAINGNSTFFCVSICMYSLVSQPNNLLVILTAFHRFHPRKSTAFASSINPLSFTGSCKDPCLMSNNSLSRISLLKVLHSMLQTFSYSVCIFVNGLCKTSFPVPVLPLRVQ